MTGLELSGQVAIRSTVPTLLADLVFSDVTDVALDLGGGAHQVSRVAMDDSVASGIAVAEGASLQLAHATLRGLSGTGIDAEGSAEIDTSLLVDGGTGVVVGSAGAMSARNSTIAGHAGAGVDNAVGGTVSITSTIVWDNSPDLVNVDCSDLSFSDVGDVDCSASGNNANVDPSFVGGGDFHLADDSPLVELGPGPLEYTGDPCQDLDDGPRLRDHDRDGLARMDVGAYEAISPLPAPEVDIQWTAPDVLAWTASPGASAYNVYRGSLATLSFIDFGSCLAAGQILTSIVEDEPLAAGEGRFYLVTVVDTPPAEGTLGLGKCAERSNFNRCP
jgi:hypothetical protein